jgi:hypothetical protein
MRPGFKTDFPARRSLLAVWASSIIKYCEYSKCIVLHAVVIIAKYDGNRGFVDDDLVH